jgi:hypothetical protein
MAWPLENVKRNFVGTNYRGHHSHWPQWLWLMSSPDNGTSGSSIKTHLLVISGVITTERHILQGKEMIVLHGTGIACLLKWNGKSGLEIYDGLKNCLHYNHRYCTCTLL